MARIRTIKPSFWTDEDMASCSETARLMAIGLLNHADDEGYFKAHPALIRAAIFPFTEDSLNIHGVLKQLENIGYLRLFEGENGKVFGHVCGFAEHQRVNRPNPSKIKRLDPLTEDSLNTHGGLTAGREGKGKEYIEGKSPKGKPKKKKKATKKRTANTTPKPKATKRAPQAWTPSAELQADMKRECPDVDILAQLRMLRDHEFATARSDWDAVFRNWIRRAATMPGARKRPDDEVRIPPGPPSERGLA